MRVGWSFISRVYQYYSKWSDHPILMLLGYRVLISFSEMIKNGKVTKY